MNDLDHLAGSPRLRVAVLADTHIAPPSSRRLPDAAYEELLAADAILHAGDVVHPGFLDELEGVAPLAAVLGNNDVELVGALPDRLELVLAGLRVAMVHDSGARAGRAARLRRWFPHADVVVFGHSHLPVDEEGVDDQRLFNPGSPTWKRMAPTATVGRWVIEGGRLVDHRLIDVA